MVVRREAEENLVYDLRLTGTSNAHFSLQHPKSVETMLVDFVGPNAGIQQAEISP